MQMCDGDGPGTGECADSFRLLCFGVILCCFLSVQCHHATVFDGDGPGTGECADSFRLLNVLA